MKRDELKNDTQHMLADEQIILDFIFENYLKGDTAMTDNTRPATTSDFEQMGRTSMDRLKERLPKDSIYGRTFPAAANANADDYHWTDSVVTQGHADYCKLYGHATYTIDGVLQVRCPRCGDNKCHAEHNTDCGV